MELYLRPALSSGSPGGRMSRIFEAFSQAEASTAKRYGGTGLGLVISQRFCRMLGGDIGVASEPGEGTVFTVWIPRHAAARTIGADAATAGSEA
jgi:signal transduction histidine kinase